MEGRDQNFLQYAEWEIGRPPIRAFPYENKLFFVRTDASRFTLGAVLMQINNRKKMVIAV